MSKHITPERPTEPENSARWRSVYAAVVVFTIGVVLLLYLFNRWFTG